MIPNNEDLVILEWMSKNKFPWKFLSVKDERIARIRYEQNMGTEQTAEIMKTSKQNTHMKLKRIRQTMRKYMELPDSILLYSLDKNNDCNDQIL